MEIKSNMVRIELYEKVRQERNELKEKANRYENFILSLDPDNKFIPVEWDIKEMQKEIKSQKEKEYEASLPY